MAILWTFPQPTLRIFGNVLLVAIVLWLAGIVVGLLYGFSVMFTLGLMLLAYPFIGWFVLKVTEHFMSGSLTLYTDSDLTTLRLAAAHCEDSGAESAPTSRHLAHF